jgi:sulfhydrogenase subunit beta (sulfur reductase)
MSEIISERALRDLAGEWIAQGKTTIGPVRLKNGVVQYVALPGSDAFLFDGYIHPSNSIKEFIFPKHECLYSYILEGKDVKIEDTPPKIEPMLILGARPCDAAALAILDHVFNWDFKDDLFNARRTAATVVTLACSTHDDSCFCTSIGLGPAAEKGSDAMLYPLGNGEFEVRTFTDKGRALFSGKTQKSDKTATVPPGPEVKFELGDVQSFLKGHFEDPIWKDRALRCIGCGACAFTCPTCHCFDIVDERKGSHGTRSRNWDACQFTQFTAHASGHNPRGDQSQRQRQRITHKFGIYPDKFGDVLCTGCGNCIRNCPVGLGVLGILEAAAEKTKA